MKKIVSMLLTFLCITGAVFCRGQGDKKPVELRMYAGAGLRIPTEIIVKQFEEATGYRVLIEYAGMGQLLTRYLESNTGDLFLSGAESYIGDLEKAGKVLQAEKLVYHTAVMAIRKDKAEGIASFADLANSQLTLGMGDPQAIALGKSGEIMLNNSGVSAQLSSKIVVRTATAAQLTAYLLNGDIDGAIIGRSDALKNADALVILPAPEGTPQEISVIASLQTSEHPDAANQLVAWFAKPESIAVFVKEGFLPVQ